MSTRGKIKFSTYEHLTSLVKKRFEKIKLEVENILALNQPLNSVQLHTLSCYSSEITKKLNDFENNVERVIEHVEDVPQETLSDDQIEINELFIFIKSVIDSLVPSPVDHTLQAISNDSKISI